MPERRLADWLTPDYRSMDSRPSHPWPPVRPPSRAGQGSCALARALVRAYALGSVAVSSARLGSNSGELDRKARPMAYVYSMDSAKRPNNGAWHGRGSAPRPLGPGGWPPVEPAGPRSRWSNVDDQVVILHGYRDGFGGVRAADEPSRWRHSVSFKGGPRYPLDVVGANAASAGVKP